MGKLVTKSDWEGVLATMKKYLRDSGYVDFLDDKFTFFDSDPEIEGVGAMFVTRQQVSAIVNNYKE